MSRYCILPAGLQKLGNGPYGSNSVAGVLQALRNGRGVEISCSQAVTGDIWADKRGNLHIGIVWEADSNGAAKILSNSSSKAAFNWLAKVENINKFYGGGEGQYWRITS